MRKAGYKLTEEHKRKISESAKGIKNPFYGRKHTLATRLKLKAKRRGRTPCWKGGRIKAGRYILVYAPNHPFAIRNHILEHRFIMEKHLGRYLTSKEIVHHINGIGIDNRIENLVLINRSEHNSIHKKGKCWNPYRNSLGQFCSS